MEVLDDFDIQASDSNYRSVVARIARSKPEAVVIFSSTNAGGFDREERGPRPGKAGSSSDPRTGQETEFVDTATDSALAQHEECGDREPSPHAENPAWEAYEPFA